MSPFMAELVGTALLLLLGDGVVANVVLKDTKGADSGWIVITLGWGMAVFTAVFCVAAFSGAHAGLCSPRRRSRRSVAGMRSTRRFSGW